MSVVLALPSSRRGHKRNPWIKSDASPKQHGTWREIFTSSKNADKTTFFSLFEAKAMRAPTSKLFEEREFVVDTGASMHMLSKKDLSSVHLETLRRSRTTVQTNEEAEVFVHDLGLFVTVQLREDTLAVLSLGKLCSSIAGKPLRRTRIFQCVGKRSTTTAEQTREEYCFQDGKFCTLCHRRVHHQFWHCFIFNIVSTRLVFFKFKHRAKWQASFDTQEKSQNQNKKEGWQSRCRWTFARSSRLVGGIHR